MRQEVEAYAEVVGRRHARLHGHPVFEEDEPRTETKKVRRGLRMAKRLEETAKREARNERDILREGLLLAERVRARQDALEGMLAFVDDEAVPKERVDPR